MAETGLTPEIDLDGLTPDEAFAVLGNEIRLDIVRVLWNADATYEYDDVSDTAETISFSELRRRVDIDDNGKFSYHLSQLVPHFIRQTADGYRLSGVGKQIARTVIAVSGPENVEFSTNLEQDCPVCTAPLTAVYEDQWLGSVAPGVTGYSVTKRRMVRSSFQTTRLQACRSVLPTKPSQPDSIGAC
jgi:hypothetical protein